VSKYGYDNLLALLRTEISVLADDKQVQKCLRFCIDAHEGQFRENHDGTKNTVPYIVHPIGVATIAAQYLEKANSEDSLKVIVMASLAHDVLEDTQAQTRELLNVCGERVTEIVTVLSKPQIQSGETNLDRNNRFLTQIINGGETSMYIKVCDSIHNLSQPRRSPRHLVSKALVKAERNYLKFFEKGLKSIELEKRYLETIESCIVYIEKHSESKGSETPKTTEEFVSKVFKYSKRKAVESHDIVDFLRESFDQMTIRVLTKTRLQEIVSADGSGKDGKKLPNILIEEGEKETAILPKAFRRNSVFGNTDNVLIYDFGSLLGDQKAFEYLFVGFQSNQAPEWLTYELLEMSLSYLTENTRTHRVSHIEGLSKAAREFDIHLSSKILSKTNLTFAGILQMRKILIDARSVKYSLLGALESELDVLPASLLVFPIESRIKDPESILAKYYSRGYQAFSQIEDLLGIRMVAPNKKVSSQLEQICLSIIQSNNLCDTPDPEFVQIISSSGYSAKHSSFYFSSPSISENRIGCEIQIRTVLEDGWARLSELYSYKSGKISAVNTKNLKELSKLRDKGEELVDLLSEN